MFVSAISKTEGGILTIDKAQGYSSFSMVKVLRAVLKEKRVGHCGTLDPMATGLLLVVYGKATKCAESLMHQKKVYAAQLLLGIKTDTGDKTGQIVQQSTELPVLNNDLILNTFQKFTGNILQETPLYSASKMQGRKLYEYARAGIAVQAPLRQITIYSITLESFTNHTINFTVECSSGTYIRTLAQDIAQALGCPGTLSALRRLRIGEFTVDGSLCIDDVRAMDRQQLLTYAHDCKI